ncbi:MAG: hypothetical protein LBK66_00700 [Spirochaetaceae bacterium]|jgi:hypothetical protein|nr:hypothetical protein [Spirochaetaceae bacterium]
MIDRTAIMLNFQQYPVLLPDAVKVFNTCTTLTLNGLKVTSKLLKQPITTLGYCFEYSRKMRGILRFSNGIWRGNFSFRSNSILVYDGTRAESKYQTGKQGRGTYLENTISGAKEPGVKKLVIFYRKPSRMDNTMRKIEDRRFPKNSGMEIIAA